MEQPFESPAEADQVVVVVAGGGRVEDWSLDDIGELQVEGGRVEDWSLDDQADGATIVM